MSDTTILPSKPIQSKDVPQQLPAGAVEEAPLDKANQPAMSVFSGRRPLFRR